MDHVANDVHERAAAARRQSSQLAESALGHMAFEAMSMRLERLTAELEATRAQVRNLERALVTSRSIAMAVGIVMARQGLTPDAAFDVLRVASQRSHRKLHAIAEDVVFTGEVPAA
jgi:AmiR/NasT family two-component response regulator